MTESQNVAGGRTGKLAGKAKEVAGDLLGQENLAREGRLQQAGSEAEAEAAARRAEAEREKEKAETRAEGDQAELEARELRAELTAEQQEKAGEAQREQ